VNQWIPDHLHWFLAKNADAQRKEFIGHGGMLTIYLLKDPKTVAPKLSFPRIITSHPSFDDSINSDIDELYALKGAFLVCRPA
jgi:hypothetical protein